MKYLLLLILTIRIPSFAASHGTAAGKIMNITIKKLAMSLFDLKAITQIHGMWNHSYNNDCKGKSL